MATGSAEAGGSWLAMGFLLMHLMLTAMRIAVNHPTLVGIETVQCLVFVMQNDVREKNYFSSSDPHHDMLGFGHILNIF